MKKYKILNIISVIVLIAAIILMGVSFNIKAQALELINSGQADQAVGGTFIVILAVSIISITSIVSAVGLILSLIGVKAADKKLKIWAIVMAVLFAIILITMICSIFFFE